jgi:tetratricopeptide (TPR) repeat protein
VLEQLVRKQPDVTPYAVRLGGSRLNAAIALKSQGDFSLSLPWVDDAIRDLKPILERDASNGNAQRLLRRAYDLRTEILQRLSRVDEAIDSLSTGVELAKRIADQHPRVAGYQSDLANGHNALGNMQASAGNHPQALVSHLAAIQIREDLVAKFPTVIDYAIGLGGSYCNAGNALRNMGKPTRSLEYYQKAVERLQRALKQEPGLEIAQQFLRNSHWGRSSALRALDRIDEAINDLDKTVDLTTGKLQAHFRMQRAWMRAAGGDHAGAAAEADQVMQSDNIPARGVYEAARVFARAASAATNDAERAEPRRRELAEQYAARCMSLLQEARDAGFFNGPAKVEAFQSDSDFGALRSHTGFAKFLAELKLK